jgi:hypothetical protein
MFVLGLLVKEKAAESCCGCCDADLRAWWLGAAEVRSEARRESERGLRGCGVLGWIADSLAGAWEDWAVVGRRL